MKYYTVLLFMILTISAGNSIVYSEENKMHLLDGTIQEKVNRIIILSSGGIILGESLLLLAGMNIPAPSEWSSLKNIGLSIMDIILGGYLVYAALYKPDIQTSAPFYAAAAILLITHGYREYEFITKQPNAFCANTPLFIFNNVKIAGLVSSFCISLAVRF